MNMMKSKLLLENETSVKSARKRLPMLWGAIVLIVLIGCAVLAAYDVGHISMIWASIAIFLAGYLGFYSSNKLSPLPILRPQERTNRAAAVTRQFTIAGLSMLGISLIYHEWIASVTVVILASCLIIGLSVTATTNRLRTNYKQLIAQEVQLTLMCNNMPDVVLRFDARGICIFASAAATEVLGRSPEELMGKYANDAAHADAVTKITAAQERLLSGLSKRERVTYRRLLDSPKGEPVYIEADCVAVSQHGEPDPLTVIVSCRDVTERVSIEREMVAARRQAENAALSKSQFLANMSHEIRTPMNGIMGFSQLLQQSNLPQEEQRHAEMILDSCDSLTSLLNDILDLSKIESGQVAVTPGPVDIRHLLRDCIQLHFANAQEKGLNIVDDISAELPNIIETDALRLRQILLNLLGNAVKFTEAGDVELKAERVDHDLLIVVSDSGIGIQADRLEAIFRPFEQADHNTSNMFGGTGLGLSISRRLAELLGGTLTAHSTMGEGAQFKLTIPLIAAERQTPPSHSTNPAAHSRVTTSLPARSRILLAEDNEINQKLVSTMLERCGQDVDIAPDGAAAITQILDARAKDEPYDLVLMDLQMPECGGLEASQILRLLGVIAEELPIIAFSANAYEDDVQASLASGMQAHLAKPIHFADLTKTLHEWLPQPAPKDESADGTAVMLQLPKPEATAEPEATPQAAVNPNQELLGLSNFEMLEKKWQQQRQFVLTSVASAIRNGALADTPLDVLARTIHTLAGTAGMFGEDELGNRAREFERAIKQGADNKEQMRLANALLDAA